MKLIFIFCGISKCKLQASKSGSGGWVGGWGGGVMLVNGTLDAHFERVGCNGWIQAQQFFFGKTGTLGLDETFACGDV